MSKVTKQLNKSSGSQPPSAQSFYQPLEQQMLQPEILMIQKPSHEDIQMLQGQQLLFQKPFNIYDQETKKQAQLYLTNYRLIIPREELKSIPYGYIHSLVVNDKSLKIQMKTGLTYEIVTQGHSKDLSAYILMSIDKLPFCLNNTLQLQVPITYDSWAEIDRMTVDRQAFSMAKNTEGSICPTYPLYFLIPKGYEIRTLEQIKKCRHKGRFPVMSYYESKTSGGIWRASKKYDNLSKQKQIFDKSYLNSISSSLQIIDLDQKIINTNKLQSLPALKASFGNLVSKYYKNLNTYPPDKCDQLLRNLGEWFQEVSRIISLAYFVAALVNKGQHVLLQEMYGYDRVPQILALAEIILDPYYRTFKGLVILIQKQFISFGHPFTNRCGFNRNRMEQSSPVFVQLLQCVHQLIIAHPSCFQYSPSYLATIGYELYTTKYKNFIANPHTVISKPLQPEHKKHEKLPYCFKNIWDKANRQRCHKNYHYVEGATKQLFKIRPKPSMKQYEIWITYLDMICKMNGEKTVKGNPLAQSLTLYKYLKRRQL